MKAVILAGGYGTRISEESDYKPKPLVQVGGMPLLWHIMKTYSCYGISDFVVCLGYKGYLIKEFFANYKLHVSDVTIDLGSGRSSVISSQSEDWRVTLVDTGLDTKTGSRIKKIADFIDKSPFCLTYGDGLSDVNIQSKIEFHKKHGKIATVTAVRKPGRFGVIELNDDQTVSSFREKPTNKAERVNGGFFVLEPKIFEYIPNYDCSWEDEVLPALSEARQLVAFPHDGFWQPCDTLRDKRVLENLWASNSPPWRTWN